MIESATAYQFFVPGPPVPFTRVLRGSKQARAERYRAYRLAVGFKAKEAGAEIIEGPVHVGIDIYDDQKRRRYDLDNVFKGILDALNGICFIDDRQVESGRFRLHKGGDAGVEICVMTKLGDD